MVGLKIVTFLDETRSMPNLGIIGDQLCQSCSNYLVYFGKQVELKAIP